MSQDGLAPPRDAALGLSDAEERAGSGRVSPVLIPGATLGIAGAAVAVATANGTPSSNVLPMAFLVILAAIGLAAAARASRADRWLATLIVIRVMFPNSSTNLSVRIVAGGFRIFTRPFGGVLSLWDVLLGLLCILALWMHAATGRSRPAADRPARAFLLGIALVCGLAALNGLIHAAFVDYGPTSFRSVVQQTLPIVYLFASMAIGSLAVLDRASVWRVVWAVRLAAIATLTEGSVLLVLALRGAYPAMRGIGGIPIVLYDQLAVLNVFVCFMIARLAAGLRLKAGDWLVVMGSVVFLLMSTRRLVFVMLIVNALLIVGLSVRRGRVLRTFGKVGLAGFAVAVAVVGLIVVALPRFVEAMRLVIGSFNVTSAVGLEYAGGIRLAELQNLLRNLGPGLSPFWVVGRGLGTYWREYVPMGLSLQAGSTAFTEGVLGTGVYGWWPNFHLPYVSLLYRFGVAGTVVIWGLVWGWVLQLRSKCGGFTGAEAAFAIAVAVLGAGQLLSIGESLDSAGPALLGLLIAATAGLGGASPLSGGTKGVV
jgi:hypothetical protein